MKVTIDRVKIMQSIAVEGAYILPNRFIPMDFRIDERLEFVGEKMWWALIINKYIERKSPPKKLRDSFVCVWEITDKGLDWLSNAEEQLNNSEKRLADFAEKRKAAEKQFQIKERVLNLKNSERISSPTA
jgi:hypothetical protein